jgi:hypothetical protein
VDTTTTSTLSKKIENTRLEMIRLAKTLGLSSSETVQCSQKLDDLLLLWQKSQVEKEIKAEFCSCHL